MSENTANTTPAAPQNDDLAEIERLFREPAPRYRSAFQPYPEDPVQAGIRRIRDVLSLKEIGSNIICMAGREQVDEWCSWLQSVVTDVAGHQFQDLFPPEAIAQYCDSHGKRLPGLHPIMQPEKGEYSAAWETIMEDLRARSRLADIEPTVYWQYMDPDDPDLTLDQQVDYLRLEALPGAALNLMSAFSNETLILQDETDELKAKLAELEQQNRELQSQLSDCEHRYGELEKRYNDTAAELDAINDLLGNH